MPWCKGACDDEQCAPCTECKEKKECTPHDKWDVNYDQCLQWCASQFSSEHCEKCACKKCDFCMALVPGFEPSEPQQEIEVEATPLPPLPMQNNHKCYAYMYPDLLQGYCRGDVATCDARLLDEHYNKYGKEEGRHFACKTRDAQCYVMRYPDLLEGYCPTKKVPECNFVEVLKQYSLAGITEGRILKCRGADAECYVRRYPDLLDGYCRGSVEGCDWWSVVQHYFMVGAKEQRVFGCLPPGMTLPPPPPPPRRTSPPPPPPPPSPPPPPPPKPEVIKAPAFSLDAEVDELGETPRPAAKVEPNAAVPSPNAEESTGGGGLDLPRIAILLAASLVLLYVVARMRRGARSQHLNRIPRGSPLTSASLCRTDETEIAVADAADDPDSEMAAFDDDEDDEDDEDEPPQRQYKNGKKQKPWKKRRADRLLGESLE